MLTNYAETLAEAGPHVFLDDHHIGVRDDQSQLGQIGCVPVKEINYVESSSIAIKFLPLPTDLQGVSFSHPIGHFDISLL